MDLAVSSNIEPPPLLFGARASSPTQASQHQQHSHSQSPITSQSPPPDSAPPLAAEMDLSTSTTLPQPEGQNHDRSDSQMDNTDDYSNGHLVEPLNIGSANSEDNARQQDEVPEAMDTTPDSQPEPSSNGIAISEHGTQIPNPTVTSEAGEGRPAPPEESASENATHTAEPNAEDPRQDMDGANTENGTNATPPPPPLDPEESGVPPPPPAPLVDVEQPQADTSTNQRDFSGSDTSSEEGEEPRQIRWEEDLSTPDEEELKEIEEKGPEISALDYDHWQTKFFTELDDPEYVPGETARIDWKVTNVHGSLENPNTETVMRSPKFRLGGLDWNIKYYPRGNDTEQLSIYIECAKPQPEEKGTTEAVADEEQQDPNALSQEAAPIPSEQDAAAPAQTGTEPSAERPTSSPSNPDPEEGDVAVEDPKEEQDNTWSTAAQFGVVIYNPNEPRVKYNHGNRHRFCAKSPDWGWTRFHGPHGQIHQRFRGERQALLRNDTLAFSAYVRIIKDDTGALWEAGHTSDWDSLAKTGIRAIGSLRHDWNPVVTAIQAWLLFAPFRELICATTTPDPIKEPRATPKPLIAALQKIVYSLQDRKKPTSSPVTLEGLSKAFSWYGFRWGIADVVAFWELLRWLMEYELRGTSTEGRLGTLFDGLLDKTANHDNEDISKDSQSRLGAFSAGKAHSFRVPVKGVQNVQAAIAQTLNYGDPTSRPKILSPPVFLQIELDRQLFDKNTRRWKKLVDKVVIDEEIDLQPWIINPDIESKYLLYGFIVHSDDLHSGRYYSVVRPGGPGTRWLRCQDYRSNSTVKCLTRKQALDRHCGIASGKKSDGTEPVAYVVMYVRKDFEGDGLKGIPEPWKAPEWIKEDDADPDSPIEASQEVPPENETLTGDEQLQLLVYDSRLFNGRTGEGLISFDDTRLDDNYVYEITVSAKAKLSTTIEALNDQVPSLKGDNSDAWIWLMDCDDRATIHHPCLVRDSEDEWTFERVRQEEPALRIWLHLLTPADTKFTTERKVVPPPIVPDNPPPAEDPNTSSSSSDTDSSVPGPRVEDVIEAEQAEGQTAAQPTMSNIGAEAVTSTEANSSEDTTMAEASADVPASGIDEPSSDSVPSQPPSTEVPSPSLHVDTSVPPDTEQPTGPAPDADMEDLAVEVAPSSHNEPTEVGQSSSDSEPAVSSFQTAAEANRVLEQNDVDMEDLLREEAEVAAESAPEGQAQSVPESTVAAEATPPLPHLDNVVYFFLKRFDAKEQTLKAVGSFFAHEDEDMGDCVRRLLDLPKDKAITIWCEERAAEVRRLDLPRKVAQDFDQPGHIFIVQDALSDAETLAIEEKQGHPHPKTYIKNIVAERSSPLTNNGHLTCSYFSSSYTSGFLINGRLHGHGTTTALNGQTYTGNFMTSYKHGHGEMIYQNKDIYTGNFHKSEMHGQGKMVYAKTGNVYEGGWKNGRKHGKGIMTFQVSDEEERLCQICYETEMDALFYDCGHVCACLDCARQVDSCPVCRRNVIAVVRIFRT
ncbi:MAG: hypothetical protein M1812_007412 [Candelaria pacifica]|nr:MAG: hypothetical protein M1812_007412 [Candelaria pacifica]